MAFNTASNRGHLTFVLQVGHGCFLILAYRFCCAPLGMYWWSQVHPFYGNSLFDEAGMRTHLLDVMMIQMASWALGCSIVILVRWAEPHHSLNVFICVAVLFNSIAGNWSLLEFFDPVTITAWRSNCQLHDRFFSDHDGCWHLFDDLQAYGGLRITDHAGDFCVRERSRHTCFHGFFV